MKTALNIHQLFTVFGLYFLSLEVFGLVLAMTGFFYWWLVVTYITLSGLFFIYLIWKNRKIFKESLKLGPVIILSLLFIALFSHFTTPTVFSGRDQGSFSEAATRLSQNHKLTFDTPASRQFFKIYGTGEALNFPGFDYLKSGKLVTHFPLGYVAWLAIFYSLFGFYGLILANAVTMFIFFLSFFLVARKYLRSQFAVWAWLLALTSFSFMWFFKYTLGENLALSLFWFGLWELIHFWKTEKNIYLWASLLSFSVLAFTRIEALAVLVMVFALLGIRYRNWNPIKEKLKRKEILLPLLFLSALFVFDFVINMPFYRIFAKGFINSFSSSSLPDGSSYAFPYPYFYLIRIFWMYAILNFIILAVIGVIYFLKDKKYQILVPAFISLPVMIYLINPSISSDHPWMLRRFVFIILPLAILYTVLFIERFFSKKLFSYVILFLLLMTNLAVFVPYISRAENINLAKETEEFSRNFGPQDLILMDREATGSGWSMISGPLNFLYQKQTAYFFNPDDFGKIDKSGFQNVYLVIPDKNYNFYAASGILDKFSAWKDYEIEDETLNIKTGSKSDLYESPIEFPQEIQVITKGKIYKYN